jgi:tetratricopeptide (TPR) repeat protein
MLDHYLHTAHAADRLLDPITDPNTTLTPTQPGVTLEHSADYQQALDWFTTEHPVLLTAIDHAAATGFDTHTWQLAWTMSTFLERRGHWHDWAATGRVAVAAACRLADPDAQARVHRSLGHVYIRLGRLDDAHIELNRALDLCLQTGDLTQQAHTHNRLAHLWDQRGDYPQALDHARQALTLYQAAGNQCGQAYALSNVGWCHALLGDQQALTTCQQALTLFQELGDPAGQAATWDSLAYAHRRLDQHAYAITSYQHALALFRDLGIRYEEAATLTRLGDTHRTVRNHDAARDAWRQALTILDDLDHPDAHRLRTKLADLDTPASDPTDRDARYDGQPASGT